ncbi:MAG: hypothetical protein KAS75_08120 [Planctomycetes bacterium]|nr:hypothetical protein [Planctomycetota bacterium]
MDGQNYLGIYLSETTATVVCIDSQSRDRKVLGCFSVSVEPSEEPNTQTLASLIAQGCDERNLKFSEIAVALDCRMFMQHKIHSEFNDPKQIAATIRFDTEEAISSDISEVAIAFKIISSGDTGSDMIVFTAQRKALSEILLALQSNNIDPVNIEPDINCLSRFLLQSDTKNLSAESNPLFAMLSASNGYFIAFDKSQQNQIERTFLINQTQNRSDLLAREIPITTVSANVEEPINCLKVFDSAESIDYTQLTERIGYEAASIDLVNAETLADCDNAVDFVIAYGAALAHSHKPQSVNFRDDFMPYQGKKVRLQKNLKILSISLAAFCLAIGLYFQMQLMQQNKYRGQLRKKFAKQYSAVMLGQKLPRKINPLNKLRSEKKRIENAKSGQLSVTGEETISAKLTSVFQSFNEIAKQTNLNIDSISITTKSINIVGDTSSRSNTLKVFKAIKGSENSQKRLQPKGGRDSFSITIVPEKR